MVLTEIDDGATPVASKDERLARFINHLSYGKSVSVAAIESGYSAPTGFRIVERPDFVPMLRAALQRRLLVDGATIAIQVLIDIASDPETAKSVRVDAAKAIVDRAGVVVSKRESGQADISLAEMTREQLLRLASSAESELATRAKRVDAPKAPVSNTQPIDIFE